MNSLNKLIAITMILLMISAALAHEQPAFRPQATGAARVGSGDNLSAAANGCSGANFGQPAGSPITVGHTPISIAAGDFNLDGNLDLGVANADSDTVTILLGNGNGGFTRPADIPVRGSRPVSIAVGDFNRDGKPDLAVANYTSGNLSILLGNGAGGFTEAVGSPVAAGEQPIFITVSDFNRDGKADLAVANWGSNNLAILLGNGSGGFAPATGSPVVVGVEPEFMTVADFNLDDRDDLAISRGKEVIILSGNGNVIRQGCVISLEHNADDRRVQAKIDKTVFKGTASLQAPAGSLRCTINDRDTRNNDCSCR